MSIWSRDTQRPVAFVAAGMLLGAALAVLSSAPATASLSATGIWIFPHERQEKVLAGTLGSLFYNTTSGDEWIADAFFADADADGATVEVDFYNPTSGNLTNVILWVAVSNSTLFTSINFSGGAGGDQSVGVDDLGAGTPFAGAPLPSYVYPTNFTSYAVGDVDAGSSGIVTVTLDVIGDFDGGLVLRLDYVATSGESAVSGPFDAGMSIYEWGDLPADEPEGPDGTGLTPQRPSAWAGDIKQALLDEERDGDRADYNTSAYAAFMQDIALHSGVFAYGPWEGEDPLGGEDEGWIDLADLDDARDVLLKRGSGHGNVKELEQELLALWLNAASGRVDPDSALEWAEGKGGDGEGDDGTDIEIPADVGAIISQSEDTLAEYLDAGDDSGPNRGYHQAAKALWDAATLCWLVNAGWLEADA
ncbi:MAG TPA: hypothetical protein VGB42_06610 [Candidatus Thermoplasmatota archaeon]